MAPSGRGRPFVFTFYPNGSVIDEAPESAPATSQQRRRRIIPVNSFAPIEIENEHFKGAMVLIHETGNEPERDDEDALDEDALDEAVEGGGDLRGLQLQVQGQFKKAIARGKLWAGGELQDNLKLGWFMQNVVKLCANYAKKKTEGRLHFNLGGKGELPLMTFPMTQVFSVIATPPGGELLKLGSKELSDKIVWQGPTEIEINTTDTYTLVYKTGFVDLCSWELLKVPGVSPLPLENLLGDVQSSRVMLYDSAATDGNHANWRDGVLIEWLFMRGKPGEKWYEDDILDWRKPSEVATADHHENEGEGSDASDSSQGDEIVDLIDDVDDDAGAHGDESDDSSESSQESLIGEDEEAFLCDVEGWRPRTIVPHDQVDEKLGVSIRVPFYIESIDRRRRRKLRVWYVFAILHKGGSDELWLAKPIWELAALCGRRRTLRTRLKTFRRGSALGCQCYGVQTLEQFRHVVRSAVCKDSKLTHNILHSASTAPTRNNSSSEAENAEQDQDLAPRPWELGKITKLHAGGPAELARKMKAKKVMVPPRFLVGSGNKACELAFVHAKDGRNNMEREGLVGVVQFEGRICEELLRLSRDAILRVFSPFDCDKARLKLPVSHIAKVEAIDGLFLGRFFRWEVHTELKVLVFCVADEEERNAWIATLRAAIVDESPSRFFNWATGSVAAYLMDTTRSRRWRPKKRLVLNDRILLDDTTESMPPSLVEVMLQQVLSFRTVFCPDLVQVTEFLNRSSFLKAVRFGDLSQSDLLSFWLNVYHCLLLHGRLMLGTPRSRRELSRFFNRVSYLVGSRPVSLKEIERIILRMPNLDSVTGIRATGRAKARQVVGFCGLCRRRALGNRGRSDCATSTPTSSVVALEKAMSTESCDSAGSSPQPTSVVQKRACFPHIASMVSLREPPWSRRRVHACLFLGQAPEALAIPKQDLRVVLCLNRGNASCLPNVPVFRSAGLGNQLDEVSGDFIEEFVTIRENARGVTQITLPHSCKCLKRELNMDQETLVNFVWKFTKTDIAKPSKRIQIKFDKYRPAPRHGLALDHRSRIFEVGSEYAVVTAAAQALANFMEKHGFPGGIIKDRLEGSSKARSDGTRSPASSRHGGERSPASSSRAGDKAGSVSPGQALSEVSVSKAEVLQEPTVVEPPLAERSSPEQGSIVQAPPVRERVDERCLTVIHL
eukprot:TRINITY_DN62259_c0_g1_i1.p1 TRINITY_DN62259_c0_g1~~TRINITY_DN62259_c0_g1_i1.p1  ORF type:complete len:1179 (+),score=216.78 TRINITY_DN62259_c0_g1_i1:21-3557(+)